VTADFADELIRFRWRQSCASIVQGFQVPVDRRGGSSSVQIERRVVDRRDVDRR